jgi:murein DD-endopeptidase MepM/ murein hydrolase activator NlpD
MSASMARAGTASAIAACVAVGCVLAGCSSRPEPRPIALASAAAHDIALQSEKVVVSARVAAGATLASLLKAEHVAAGDAVALVAKAAAVFDPRKVRANQPYRLETARDGLVERFEYEIDGDRFLRVTRGADRALEAVVLPIPKTRTIARVDGRIDRNASSLVAAMDAAGETIDLTLALADILGGEIDFSTELQPGDSFSVLVEKQFREDDTFAGYGPVAAVEFINAGRRVRAVRFTPEGGQPGYYDERGISMKRFFLASPLKFQPVVTSSFSTNRFHPILREYRAHLGVDYRAPAGAPVVAVADGTVVSAGMAGGSGRMVHLRHANGFESEYLHLSVITVRPGMHVRQGELVGRVGASGLATAPHLDYRLKRNGVFINPVTAHRAMPPADPVPSWAMRTFVVARDHVLGELGSTSSASVANPNAAVH